MINFYDFINNNELFKKFKVDELLFCEYKCPIDRDKVTIWSHNNVFFYVLSGKKKWITIKSEYLLNEGEAAFVKKGANIIQQYFYEAYCVLTIFVPDSFIKNVIEKHQLKLLSGDKKYQSDKVIRINVDEVLTTYFQSVLSYFLKPEPPLKDLLKLKFEEFIISLLANNNNLELASYFKEISASNRISLKEIMEGNFYYNMRLDEYARLSGRSLSVFKRDFESTFNTTPGKWLTKKRIQFAKYLIENSEKTLDEIIIESGFKNQSHFIKVFKDTYQTTPSKFKRNL